MSNDKKTLADVQPGGMVRLGDRPKDGEVLVEVSGLTGSGKSAIAGEIEILCKTLGLEVEWVNGDEEKRLTHADWIGALEMYKPKVVILERNVSRSPDTRHQACEPSLETAARAAIPFVAYAFSEGVDSAEEAGRAIEAALSAQPSPGGQDALLGYVCVEAIKALREDDEVTGVMVHVEERTNSVPVYLTTRQPVGEPVSDECEGCEGGIRYDAQGCSCMTCGKRPKWYMAGRRIRITERRKPWKHLGAPVPFEAECTWQMGDSIDYRLDGETTSRRLNNFHQHWEKVEVIR